MSDLLLNALSRNTQQSLLEPQQASVLSEEEKNRIALALEEAKKTDSKDKQQLEVEDAAWSSEDSLAAAQRFFSSTALGWGDEMGLWTAAAAASVATGTPIKEVYADMRKTYDAQQEQFKERQPGAAMAADIAGSIASDRKSVV